MPAIRDWRPGFERWVVRFSIACPCAVVVLFLVLLFARPGITPDEHRMAVAGVFPQHAATGTETLSPYQRGLACWDERVAWMKRRFSFDVNADIDNRYTKLAIRELASVNCLLH